MGNFSDLCLAPKIQEKILDHLMETCLPGCCVPGSCVPEDRISYLPDDILLVILSFLTMNDVAKTSLLSRRWLNVWMHTSVLNFLAPDWMYSLYYVALVNHALERHKGRCLKEFKIVCFLDDRKRKAIDNWLVFALSRKVQHLELNLSKGLMCRKLSLNNRNQYAFPDRFFEFDLKCLRSLSLENVRVTSDDVNSFLMNCPLLERLEVVGAFRFDNLVIPGPNLALKYLQIRHCYYLKVLCISNANLVSLDIPPVRDLTLTNLPKLVELSISRKTAFSTSHSLSIVGSCRSQLEALTLRGLALEEAIGLSNLDRMTKLKRLVIEVNARKDESLVRLISVINSCPCLKEFVLMLDWRVHQRITRTMCEVENGGQSKSLRVFEFFGYYGRVSDAELIKHVVENVVCLEKIIIDPRHPECLKYPLDDNPEEEHEMRSFALIQLEDLRKTKSIPPYVDVVIR